MEVGRVRPTGPNPQGRREVQRPEGGKGELPSNRLNRKSKLTTSTAFILQHRSFNRKTRLSGISLSPASAICLKIVIPYRCRRSSVSSQPVSRHNRLLPVLRVEPGLVGDPFEAGNSRPLDFGHWAAHKLEQISAYRLRHGEAVAVGMAIDATYSYLAGLLSETPWRRILETLVRLGFTFHVPELARTDDLLRGLKEFQEHLGGCLTVMLLTDIGKGREVHAMEQELIFRALARLQEIEREEYHENR